MNYNLIKTKRNRYRMTWSVSTRTGLHTIVGSEFEVLGGKSGLKAYISNFKKAFPNDSIIVTD